MDNNATLSEEEVSELNARIAVIGFHERTLALLLSEKNLFLNHLLTEKGLDPTKKYTINDDRTLSEVT